jgi:tRNA nucleotidyltransferase (CCA-adding enzyme)
VIDHHPPRENVPPGWAVVSEEIGATTTLLIEALREHSDSALNSIQATLLLLGIYEDTGSLTYTRTTARDLRAAAFLIEQGASLQIASSFLNHPLSDQQQAIYDELRRNVDHIHLHGHTIIIASGNAAGLEEELSSLAHKLRDLLDPDALFLVLETRGGVQLIARSTSDNIDVAQIASIFGGGGHERAAAALIRGQDIDNVRATLLSALHEHVRPAVRVAQLMSRGLQVLSPDSPVEEAAERMRRYGYEGYPVVEDGKVVGLLTRRAVDRALSHRLNLKVASVMEKGSFTTEPEHSVEQLQRIMTDSGWGQIPVVRSDTGEIVGIVTRTDLLKTLTPQARLPGRINLGSRLERALPPSRLVLLKTIASEGVEQHAAVYIVGGFVRDLLLDRPSLDFDLVIEGDAIALAHALQRKFGGKVTTHARFGTAKWRLPEKLNLDGKTLPSPLPYIDLISARTEFYTHPTALPTIERGSIKLDLHRRDFTINTLALRLDGRHYGELSDYWGGLSDLRHGLVRVLHSLSFVDDPTRMLRAVRFEQRFRFRLEDRTEELLREALPLLDRVSGDRIRHELDHILSEPRAADMLDRLHALKLLNAIHPRLQWDSWLRTRIEALEFKEPDPDWELPGGAANIRIGLAYCLWLLRLPPEDARSAVQRIKLSSDLRAASAAAGMLWQSLPSLGEAAPSQVVERLDPVPPLARYAVYRATADIHLRRILQTYAAQWRKISPFTDGHALRQRGIPPGPAYKQILAALRNAWLDGKIKSQGEEMALLEELLNA